MKRIPGTVIPFILTFAMNANAQDIILRGTVTDTEKEFGDKIDDLVRHPLKNCCGKRNEAGD